MGLIITDFDQTLTKEGRDFWYDATFSAIDQKERDLFLRHMENFKRKVNDNPVEESLKMFNHGLSFIKSLETIRNYFQENLSWENIRMDLYQFIINFLNQDPSNYLLISSANYQIGVEIAKEKFFSHHLDRVFVSGTIINNQNMRVDHINVAQNKIKGIELTLKRTIEEITHEIEYCFGDDPIVNDKYILDLKLSRSFLLNTQKNKDILTSYNRIGTTSEVI